jgi:Tfp pilus assembly protein PilN
MRAINLLPRDEQRPRLERLRVPLLALAGGLVAASVVAGVLAVSASGSASDRRAELAAVEAELDRLPRAPRPAVSQGMLAQERSNRTAALAAALGTRSAADEVLEQIALVLPDDVWLTGLRLVTPAAVPVASGAATGTPPAVAAPATPGVTIEGATYTHEGVARALARLAIVPSLAGVRLTSSSLAEQAATTTQPGGQGEPAKKTPGRKFVTFTISASLAAGGGK